MRPSLRIFLLSMPLLLAGCGQPSDVLDCAGTGTARGYYDEINSGKLDFKYAVVFPNGEGYTVIFSDDVVLADTMRHSPDPEHEGTLAATMFGRLLVGFRFDASGDLTEYLTRGSSTSSGTAVSGGGHLSIDETGCARGDIHQFYNGAGFVATPLSHPEKHGDALAIEYAAATNAAIPAAPDDDLLIRWRSAYARLAGPHPISAIQALGFSESAANVLAGDPRTQDVVERMRTQCADPATATLNEYGEVVGPSPRHDGFVFQSTISTATASDGEFIDNCYVMQRNDEALEQCWPLQTDCSKVPRYRADE